MGKQEHNIYICSATKNDGNERLSWTISRGTDDWIIPLLLMVRRKREAKVHVLIYTSSWVHTCCRLGTPPYRAYRPNSHLAVGNINMLWGDIMKIIYIICKLPKWPLARLLVRHALSEVPSEAHKQSTIGLTNGLGQACLRLYKCSP